MASAGIALAKAELFEYTQSRFAKYFPQLYLLPVRPYPPATNVVARADTAEPMRGTFVRPSPDATAMHPQAVLSKKNDEGVPPSVTAHDTSRLVPVCGGPGKPTGYYSLGDDAVMGCDGVAYSCTQFEALVGKGRCHSWRTSLRCEPARCRPFSPRAPSQRTDSQGLLVPGRHAQGAPGRRRSGPNYREVGGGRQAHPPRACTHRRRQPPRPAHPQAKPCPRPGRPASAEDAAGSGRAVRRRR